LFVPGAKKDVSVFWQHATVLSLLSILFLFAAVGIADGRASITLGIDTLIACILVL